MVFLFIWQNLRFRNICSFPYWVSVVALSNSYVYFSPQKKGPKWVVYNLAALYWRSVGNLWNGIECLRSVLGPHSDLLGPLDNVDPHHLPEDPLISDLSHPDVALANLASILYSVGYIDDALPLARRAYLLSTGHHVDTMFQLANLLTAKGTYCLSVSLLKVLIVLVSHC